MTKMNCLQISMLLQKVILQQSTKLYIILFCVKLTLSMDGVDRGTLGHLHGGTLGQCYFIPKLSSKIKIISEYEF